MTRVLLPAVLLLLATSSAKSAAGQTIAYHCNYMDQTGPQPQDLKLYSSDVFHVDASESGTAIQNAWSKYIQTTYGIKAVGIGPCDTGAIVDAPDYASDEEKRMEKLHKGLISVHVHWSYAPNHGASAAAPPEDPCVITNHKHPTGCGTPAASYAVCSANDASPTAYVSATFQVTAVDTQPWTTSFAQFLAEKYAYKGSGVGCAVVQENGFRAYLRGRVLGLRANGKKVVETGWTYNSLPAVSVEAVPPAIIPAAPPAVASSAPAVAPSKPAAHTAPAATQPPPHAPTVAPSANNAAAHTVNYAVCWAESPARKTAYFSAPFTPPAGTHHPDWSRQFRQFLAGKYGKNYSLVICQPANSLADAQRQTQTWMNAVRDRNQLVETGWKLQ